MSWLYRHARGLPDAWPIRCWNFGEATPELAAAAAKRLGFRRHTPDWRALVGDPAIDIVDICVPSNLHREIALAAIAAGKTVYCEKPVGINGGEATEIAAAARRGRQEPSGIHLSRNPLIALPAS